MSKQSALSKLLFTSFVMSIAVSLPVRAADKPAKAASPAALARADIEKAMGFVPHFLSDLPDLALPGVWEEMKTLQMNPNTALPGKVKELIGLGVAAQVPCRYCVLGHTEFAKLGGASRAEIGEAVAMAGITRHWSTFLNGIQTDDAKFRAEIGRLVENARKGAKNPPAKGVDVVDGATALADINQSIGYEPEFFRRFPDVARAGAWREFKEVEMNPQSALTGKEKELIGLAVASQVPCHYCIVAHTEFAKLNGATDAELTEAIAMASLTRNLSTLLNGLKTDEPQFRRDLDRIVKGARAAGAKPVSKLNGEESAIHTAAR